jgi:CRP-like cAMP-binding protein
MMTSDTDARGRIERGHIEPTEDAAIIDLVESLSSVLATSRAAPERNVAILRAIADAAEALGSVPSCRVVPFAPGRRSNVEERYPGLGSSDCVAAITGGDPGRNRAEILFDVGPPHPSLGVDATMRWADLAESDPGAALPGWRRRPLALSAERDGALRHLVIRPETDFAGEDIGFAHGFLRRALVDIGLSWDGVPVAAGSIGIDVCDLRNLGSLYARVLDRVVAPDTARQAANWPGSGPTPDPIHHPWSPVLIIGMEKAALYTRALVADIVDKTDHLSDPSWLLRVGVYLELLTCLGIFEAVRDDVGDLLSPQEREQFEYGDALAEIRARINVEGWKSVWELRKISPPRLGMPRAGAVSAMNLIQKKRATLAFLHVHHEDLKHAIELAGANFHNAQETWQRVFRDAERAVLRKTGEVFPELAYLPGPMRELSMWQQQGVAGQQGLYPTACTQYRASMNYVASWAKEHGLMDYTDDECVPLRVSLLDAIMNRPDMVEVLERGDGYIDVTDIRTPAKRGASDADAERMLAEFEELLAGVPILGLLSPEELRTLASGALPLLAVPGERIVVQDAAGDSLFVVADGEVEVMLRIDGKDRQVDTMGRGSVIGEMALLTGERRTATVRAIDTALILEIGARLYEPILRAHPEWIDDLAEMMEERLRLRRERLERGDVARPHRERQRATRAIRDQICSRFFADA